MLSRLSLRDFVIVDTLELAFQAGFGALTGETGAGKSILLDALGLVLGDRGDSTVVRTGKERAEIVAEFSNCSAPLLQWLEEQALADEDVLILRRIIDSSGRSRAWINGTPVTLSQLKEAGTFLADIHGQHAHHALLSPEAQRVLLDTFAQARPLAEKVRTCYRAWQQWAELSRAAQSEAAATEQERALLGWQIHELEQLAFDPVEWNELNAEHARLSHAASLIAGTDNALIALDDADQSVGSVLHRLQAELSQLAEIDIDLSEVAGLLTSATVQVDEAVQTLRRYRDRTELDPERLKEVDARLSAVHDMARKYRVQPEMLTSLLSEYRERLKGLMLRSDPAHLAQEEAAAKRIYDAAVAELSDVRANAARNLSDAITSTMHTLAMSGGRFEVALIPCQPSAAGSEKVEFQVALNPGQPLRPLSKVASGGELSRIGLAIQVRASSDTGVPTLIFDEVDAGIGGRVAEIVGQLLACLGRDRQVLCVTHLPQVAACADWQWRISKEERDGQTLSAVALLCDETRVEEIARMLGGLDITETTRRHAAEMLAKK